MLAGRPVWQREDISLPVQLWDAVSVAWLTKTDVRVIVRGPTGDILTIWQTSNERVLLISLFDVALPAARLPSCPPGCWQYVWLRGRGCLLAVCSSSINPQCYLPCCRPARLTRPLQLSQSSQFSLSACQGWRVTHILRHNSRTTSPHSWHCWKHQITKTGY